MIYKSSARRAKTANRASEKRYRSNVVRVGCADARGYRDRGRDCGVFFESNNFYGAFFSLAAMGPVMSDRRRDAPALFPAGAKKGSDPGG